MPHKKGEVVPSVESRGLYHVRITSDVGGRVAEYTLDGLVEIRTPDAVGTVSILTPLNPFYYGQGEAIPVTLLVRAKVGANLPKTAKVSLKRNGSGALFDHIVLARIESDLPKGK